MARCTNCHSKWKATDVWKLGLSKNGKDCPNCKTRQYVSLKNGGGFEGSWILERSCRFIADCIVPSVHQLK